MFAVVRVELSQRRIPVSFAKRQVGRRMYGGQEHVHPAQGQPERCRPDHLRQFRAVAAGTAHQRARFRRGLARVDHGQGQPIHRQQPERRVCGQSPRRVDRRVRLLLQLDRVDLIRQADQIRKQGGFIPGIRPGPETERYLAKAVNRITLPGALFVAIIAILPYILLWISGVERFPFADTRVLISVGVALELMRQIDSQLTLRNYEGFLK